MNGENPIQIPFPIRSSDPTFAQWAFEVVQCLKQLRDRIPQSGGSKLAQSAPATYGATIVPKRFKKVDDAWVVIFQSAKLHETSLINAGLEHEILGAGGNLTTDPPPEFALSVGTNEVWLSWTLESSGIVTPGTPELVVTGSPPEGTPMQPFRPVDGDVDGTIVQQIGLIILEDGGSPAWIPISPHVSSQCFAAGIENVGEKLSLWKEYLADEAKDQWRTIEQLEGGDSSGVDIIKTTPEDIEAGVETIQWRQVSERATSTGIDPQIHPTESADGKAIEIRGNSYSVSLAGIITSLSVVDGMVTGAISDSGTGVHANLEIYRSSFEMASEGGVLIEADLDLVGVMKWRYGILVYAKYLTLEVGTNPDDSGIDPEDIVTVKANKNEFVE